MAYQTGTAANATALLTTLVTWLNGRGWTTAASASDGLGHRAHLHKSGVYLNFRAAELEAIWANNESGADQGWGIGLYLGTGYSGASAWHAQAGGPVVSSQTHGVGMMLTAGPFAAYHFHDDGADNVVVIVEAAGGVFGFLGWGLKLSQDSHAETLPYFFGSTSGYATTVPRLSPAQTIGTRTGSGKYPFGTIEAESTVGAVGFVKVPSSIQPAANNWISNGQGTVSSFGTITPRLVGALSGHASYTGGVVDNGHPNWRSLTIQGRSVAAMYPRAIIMPAWQFVLDPVTSRYVYLGYPPSVYGCDAVGNGWAAGDILTVGGLDYKLYPSLAVRHIT